MVHRKIAPFVAEHKHALLFAGGIATAIIGAKIIKSPTTKELATKGMAGVISAKRDAEEAFQDMRENAEDIVFDASAENQQEIYVEKKE
jgi:methylmalonyl-CoA mutase cobalamin-binding subunit